MAENAQDVFDELWKRYELACNDSNPEFGHGCPRGPRGLSGDDMIIRQRFLKALKAESEDQKSCPYCHDLEKKIKTTSASYSLKFQKDKQFDLLLKRDIDYEPWTVGSLEFDYCPMCGRRLEEK